MSHQLICSLDLTYFFLCIASDPPLGVGGLVGAAGAGAGAVCALVAGACALSLRRRRRPRHDKPPPAPPRDLAAKQDHDDAEPDLIPNNYCEYHALSLPPYYLLPTGCSTG